MGLCNKFSVLRLTVVVLMAMIMLVSCDSTEVKLDVDFVTFNDGLAVLDTKNLYKYDKPIGIEEDEGVLYGPYLTGWICDEIPAAYWGIEIPEDGDYTMTFLYARDEADTIKGLARIQELDKYVK